MALRRKRPDPGVNSPQAPQAQTPAPPAMGPGNGSKGLGKPAPPATGGEGRGPTAGPPGSGKSKGKAVASPGVGGLQGRAAQTQAISTNSLADQALGKANQGSAPPGEAKNKGRGGGGGGGEEPVVPPSGPDYSACDIAFTEGTVETFDCYTVSDTNEDDLDAHQGWLAAWVLANDAIEFAEDDFESYTPEDPVTSSLNGGTGWDSAWVIVNKT